MKKSISNAYGTITCARITAYSLMLLTLAGCASGFYEPQPYYYQETVYPVYYEGHYFTPDYYRVHYGTHWQERFERDRITIVRVHPELVTHREPTNSVHVSGNSHTAYASRKPEPVKVASRMPERTPEKTASSHTGGSSASSHSSGSDHSSYSYHK